MFSPRISGFAKFLLTIAFVGATGIIQTLHAQAAGPSAIGSGECVQQGTGLTGSVTREDNYCLVALKSGTGIWVVPNGVKTVDFLIVGGGGGGGGTAQAGGGGGGSFYETQSVAVSAGSEINATVGAGGVGGTGTIGPPGTAGGNGGATTFNGEAAYGGGGGSSTGQTLGDAVNRAVSPGGSGGGDISSPVGAKKVTGTSSTTVVSDFSTAISAGTAGVGSRNDGGRSKGVFQNFTGQNLAVSFWIGAGGGGAGATGEDIVWTSDGTFSGTGMRPGKGGIGKASTLLSTTSASTLAIGEASSGDVYFAGGGGGYANFDSAGWTGFSSFSPYGLNGGQAIGSNGNNTGGGGRGGGVAGKAGVILIRYVIPQVISLGGTSSSTTEVDLTWTAPSGTETITGYKVEVSPKGENSWTLATTSPNVTNSALNATTVTGLSAATEYDFRVTPKFASGDGVTSPTVTVKTALPAQTVTWSPGNNSALASASSLTPDSLASSSGDGAITYSVHDSGTSGCSVNSTTAELSFSSPGTCVVRATAAETSNYLESYVDVSFSILSSATAVTLDLQAAIGEEVAGSELSYTATGLQSETSWDLVMRSTPQTLADGQVSKDGFVVGTVNLPDPVEPGWHSLTWTGTGAEGNTLVTTLWFKVSSDGSLIKISSVEPPEARNDSNMPGTGSEFTAINFAAALVLVFLGLTLVGVSWRIRTRN